MLKRPDARPPPARHKRFRQRRKRGGAIALVEFDCAVVDFLIKNLWLAETECADRDAVGKAIGELIKDAARR